MKVLSLISELSWSTSMWIPNTLWETLFRPLAVRHQEQWQPSKRRWITLWQETIIFPDIGMQVLLYANHRPWAYSQI